VKGARRSSLFWTVAGVFLLTLVIGSLAQLLVASAVLRPLEMRETRARAALAAANLAGELAVIPAPEAEAVLDSLIEVHRGRSGPRPAWLVFRTPDNRLHGVSPTRARLMEHALSGRPVTATPRDTTPRGPGSRAIRVELLARHDVMRGGAVVGEVLAFRPVFPDGAGEFLRSRSAFLFLPIALIVSVVGGLVLVRLLVRRLRALEVLAARVSEGDLSVRIEDTSGDEIGRLAEQLDRMTERLSEARTQLESNERQRRQLFADITHELATPLTSIRGLAETLLDPAVPITADERTRYVGGMLEEASRLDRLIRDLFELARLEAGATPLVLESLDWVALCRNTAARFETRYREAGVRLSWNARLADAWIVADGRRLEQVLENLLVNGLRYVSSGGTVQVGFEDLGDRYRLTVADDGPGMPEHELPQVFERFYRGAGARDDRGSGLGLAIVREIVERHGGTVSASTRVPHGLVFSIELPAARRERVAREPAA
jgi:signal transduction histidine kinase